MPETCDVVIVGGGHNALVAAAYLGAAGKTVRVLERLPWLGGAAISALAFAEHPTRLSRYSYLVSVMPGQLITELGLSLQLRSRAVASYTPYLRRGRAGGLLVEREEGLATKQSFRELTGGDEEHAAWTRFYADVAQSVAPITATLLQPLPTTHALRAQIDGELWRELFEEPLGQMIERRFTDDLVRGVVATDALIGTFASLHDPSLVQNRCFLYHVLGGEWQVPVGGMGQVTDALAEAARRAGADLRCNSEVVAIAVDDTGGEVEWVEHGRRRSVRARHVLSAVAPWVLAALMGREPGAKPEGAQVKVNFLLDRLPRLRCGVDPAIAFAGTLHLGEGYSELSRAYVQASSGALPSRLPGEVYCHSLTDASILNGHPGHTLTYFGLHTPARIFTRATGGSVVDDSEQSESGPNESGPSDTELRARVAERVVASLQEHLAEPLLDCVTKNSDGSPCLEVKLPGDLERELAMPGGHIFHGDLQWPWLAEQEQADTPAQAWGVATDFERLLLCGSGARRGGAVSGLGGHNAAQAVLALG